MKNSFFGLPALVVACALPATIDSSHLNMVILVLMAAQLGVSWNIVGGYAGQVSLGHAVFYGLGAYISTLMLVKFGINPWLGALSGGLVAAMFSLAFGWSCFRLKGHYFAMATIAMAELVQIFFTEWEYGGAAVGLYVPIDQQGWLWMNFATKLPYYWLAMGLLLLTVAANWWIERSYLGYYFRATSRLHFPLVHSSPPWAAVCMRKKNYTLTPIPCYLPPCRSRWPWSLFWEVLVRYLDPLSVPSY